MKVGAAGFSDLFFDHPYIFASDLLSYYLARNPTNSVGFDSPVLALACTFKQH